MPTPRIFPEPKPGDGISGLEKELRPLFAAVAKAARKANADGSANQYYLDFFRTALAGDVPEMSRGAYGNVKVSR